jgi:eukaryotic-like serine/threonine-protein kinase
MSVLLHPGQRLSTEFYAMPIVVGDLVGDGNQGEVYAAEMEGKLVAVKWYKKSTIAIDGGLRPRLRKLRDEYPAPSSKFLWPIDVVNSDATREFGYVMPFLAKSFIGIDDAIYCEKPPSLRARATAAFEMAEAYQKLHALGLCYCDISFGNTAIDVQTGEVRICDCDNVTVNDSPSVDENGKPTGIMSGTPGFRAPEIEQALAERAEIRPNLVTDLWSLSVLLFRLFLTTHPLVGSREGKVAAATLFGKQALFVFDPHDTSNEPVPGSPGHDDLIRFWDVYPKNLRDLFMQAFTVGIRHPKERVREIEWLRVNAQLRDSITPCPHCAAENFYQGGTLQSCWRCGLELPKPLCIELPGHRVVVGDDAFLYGHHIRPTSQLDLSKAIARVNRSPDYPELIGLQNLGQVPWSVVRADGENSEIATGRSVRLHPGVRINFGPVEGMVT